MLSCKIHHQESEPPEKLRHTIKCFWYTRIDLGERQSSFEVLPDGYAEIVFYFGSPCSISYNGGLQPLPSPFLTGLLNQPVLFHTRNDLEIIGIRCFPWAVFDLLGLRSGQDEVRLFEHPISPLQMTLDKCLEAGRIEEALLHVQQYFLNHRLQIAMDTMLFKAGMAMREANGTLPVGQIASVAHTTVRTLERKFKHSSGYTVKEVSSLMRFEQVRNQLWLYPNSNIAGLAYELGYADQSHLSREFKRYSGTTPAAFARKAQEGNRV